MNYANKLKKFNLTLKETFDVSLVLFRVMVPVIIVVKVLQEFGVIKYIGVILAPVMRLVGLPGDMGLVWATAMITNMYGGIVVFLSLASQNPLTTAQVTVLTTMILIAHSLPVELGIARKAGVRIRFMAPFRIISAFVLGAFLNFIYSVGNWFQQPSSSILRVTEKTGTVGEWAIDQLKNLVTIFLIILALIIIMKIFRRLKITEFINRLLKPVLVSMGIGESAATITVLGLILGISFGGGLIIRCAREGEANQKDVFFAMVLMGLCHSIVEDTLLMASLGASLTGTLLARILFCWGVMFFLIRIMSKVSHKISYRFFSR